MAFPFPSLPNALRATQGGIERMKALLAGIARSNAAPPGPSGATPDDAVGVQAAEPSTPNTTIQPQTSIPRSQTTESTDSHVSAAGSDLGIAKRRTLRSERRATRTFEMQQSEGEITRFQTVYVDPIKLRKMLVELFPPENFKVAMEEGYYQIKAARELKDSEIESVLYSSNPEVSEN